MRKVFFFFFLVILALTGCAWAEDSGFTAVPQLIRPGKMERISFSSDTVGTGRLALLHGNGEEAAVLRENVSISEGMNHFAWNGLDDSGNPLPEGNYTLSLILEGRSFTQPLAVGEPSPQILSLSAETALRQGASWSFTVETSQPGLLTVRLKTGDAWYTIYESSVPAGETTGSWDGLIDGVSILEESCVVQFILTDDSGFSGTARQISLTFAEADPASLPLATPTPEPASRVVIPSAVSSPEEENNYWTYPLGEMDEAAIWEIMMQPLVVIDGNQKDVYRLRKTPDSSTAKENIVGEITYASQGLHILETRDDGWTLVEAYNSSYGPDCASRRGYGVTDDLIQGYVKTSLLKTITPRTDYALLVDKLEQLMYIFSEGKCIGTLLVSTGLNNAKQSWNETPAGEFVMISRMGGFPAGNLWCSYGMRINGGCAIHEVPYIGDADTPTSRRDYSSTVKELGRKASHGCIRVQRAANEQGQNIKWLWDNIKVNTKVLIWDDTGRVRPYPVADDYELYYNPNGGKYYHENQYCPSVKDRFLPLSPFTYGELDASSALDDLLPCPKCTTLMRKREIDAMNALLAK